MPPADLAVTDALGFVAADGEKQDGAEFGHDGPGKEMRRLLKVQQEAVDDLPGQTSAGQPFVTEPINVEDKETHAQSTGELNDTFQGSQIIFLLHGLYCLVREDTGRTVYLYKLSCEGRIWPVQVISG